MNQITKDQHFISRFVLKNFADKNKKFPIIYKERGNIRYKSPKSVCFIDYLYETLNTDGTFYNINEIEKKFEKEEDLISKAISTMITKLNKSQPLNTDDIIVLAQTVALQLVRLPIVKNVLLGDFDKESVEGKIDAQAIFRSVLLSLDSGIGYRERNGYFLSKDDYDKISKRMNGKNMIEEKKNDIIANCFIYIARANQSEFCLSDNPVLINKFDNIPYIYPFSPHYAIVCEIADDMKAMLPNILREFKKEDVIRINRNSISQTETYLIFRNEYKDNIIEEIRKVIKEGDTSWHISTNIT